ncbi:MAG: helix-turn-helix domain-containing protein [Polyangiaceae bacterium]
MDEFQLGKRIQLLRKQRGWTLEQLAIEADVTKGFLSLVENGKTQPTGRVLLRIARALGASTDWLLSGDEEGAVAVQIEPITMPQELLQLALERNWPTRKTVRLLEVHTALLARRSEKPRHAVLTKTEWEDLADRLDPFLDKEDG